MNERFQTVAWTGLCLTLLLMFCAGCGQPSPAPVGRIPATLDLPADFRATKADWVDNERPNVGWFLGVRMLRGKAIHPRNGVVPIHVMKADLPQFPEGLLQKDDLLIGVNGRPLGEKPEEQINRGVTRILRRNKILTLTRWRRGEIATVTLDLAPVIPDLTAGDKPTDLHDWQLGPTGMNGWVYSVNATRGASRDARQILVTLVEENSPAAGVMQTGDIILGVNGTMFTRDARRVLAEAIVAAETPAQQGKLNLLVHRDGVEQTLTLTLATLPEPSPDSPYNCPKTEAIIDRACDLMKERTLKAGWLGYINALGMLASGRQDLMPQIRSFAHEICVPGEVLSIQKHTPMLCWQWSYKTLFLCEYYLTTGDEYVLPTIKEYATKIAMGQSGVGTWGHSVAAIENAGRLHGRLGGYGAINQQGLTLMIVLPLALKCGVDNQEIRDAIKRGEIFFSYYIDKGAIPYGDHRPAREWFDDNGKSGSAAIMFDLLENDRGAEFYSAMVVGSAPSGREIGHTGCFWSHLWGGIGATRAGEQAMTAFMDEMDWAFTLERHFTGRLVFQGNAGERGKSGEPKTKWDCTGARLLQLSAPRRNLYITGRGTEVQKPLSKARIRELMEGGRLATNLDARMKLSLRDILRLLEDELPAIRSVGALALREQEVQCVDKLIAMLDSDSRFARYGACYALTDSGYLSREAVTKLIHLIETSDDLDLRLHALDALSGSDPHTGLGPVAKDAIPVLLRLAVQRFEIDPRRLLQRRLGFALFDRHGLITRHGIDDLDDDLLIPAIRELLSVDDGRSRSLVATVYPHLNDGQRQQLWGDIHRAVRDISPSGIMFADGVRGEGLMLMARQGIQEGVKMTLDWMQEDRWGKGRRELTGFDILRAYGGNAREALPYLRELHKAKSGGRNPNKRDLAKLEAAIEAIEQGSERELTSIAEQILPKTE